MRQSIRFQTKSKYIVMEIHISQRVPLFPYFLFFFFFGLLLENDGNHGNAIIDGSRPRSQCTYSPATKIVGGEEAPEGAWPWQALLEITKSDGQYMCGGSLVTSNWVVTAAHCLTGAQRILVR